MELPRVHFLFCVIILAFGSLFALSDGKVPSPYSNAFNRSSFPDGFIFGAGSSAYQSEGGAFTDGKGPSIWDTFTKAHPEKIKDRSNGDVADDFYHRYKEDIQLMKKIGLDSFRFSLSWSRILPKGKLTGGVNPLGVKFYNSVINELLANGIKPFVTLFHFDTPQALEEEYGSWLSPKIVNDFLDYADFCFKTFGDRVKSWVTINQPNIFAINSYNLGIQAPGRCSSFVGNCSAGNSATEPYTVGYHLLLAHATAVKLYREKYQPYQKGKIGLTIAAHWFKPKFPTAADRRAASRANDFLFGWSIHPVIYGDYPKSMSTAGNRLPKFTESQSKLLKGSIDFLGVNYYTTKYAQHVLLSKPVNISYDADRQASVSSYKNGIPIGPPTAMSWLYVYPKGLQELLLYIKQKYNDPIIYINENGVADPNNDSLPVKEALKDSLRIRYHHSHLSYLLEAIKQGANVKGYYVWCFWDDFEWNTGYAVRFGLTYVDFKNNLKRHLKYSAYWFKKFLLK